MLKKDIIDIKNDDEFLVSYHAKKHNKQITRKAVWTNKCKLTDTYLIYFDLMQNNYRCASKPFYITAKVDLPQ